MYFRSLNRLGRILTLTAAVGFGSTGLFAQNSSSAAAKPAAASDVPASRIDFFAGYSYLGMHGAVNVPQGYVVGITGPVSYSSINLGAIGSFNYFFSQHLGAQFEYANHPDGPNDAASSAQGGIVFRYPMHFISPFVHGDAGAVRLRGPAGEPYAWGPAVTAGGGLDLNTGLFGGHLGIRIVQADYEHFREYYGIQTPPPTGGWADPNVVRLSAGLLWHAGSIAPPAPVTYGLTLSPDSVYPGDPVTVTGSANNLNPKKTTTYSWSGTNGLTVTGNTSTGTINTASLNPGTYTVTGHVSEGKKPGQFADATATLTVKQFEPPTVSCSVNPTTVQPGGTATVTAQGISPQNRPLTYTYSASAGQISGTGNSATISTAGAPAGPITITCNVQDDKGQTATATSTLNVEAPPPPPAPEVKQLCSINFDRDRRRPARVDNEAKACLDDVALNLQQQADATAVLVGEAASNERNAGRLAAQRAVNTKDYLVKEKGIDASRISVRTGTQGNKEVENYLVPSGANFDVPGTTPVDENAVKPQARTAVRRRAR